MLKVVQDPAEPNSVGASLLDEICRDGAQRMLAAALLAEPRKGFHQPRQVTTAAGAVEVRQPRVNDKRVDPVSGERRRFASAILPAWSRKSPRVGGGVAAAVSAWPVQLGLRAGVGAVPGL